MRKGQLPLLLLLLGLSPFVVRAQDIPQRYLLRYNYKVSDTFSLIHSIKPEKKLLKLLAAGNEIFIDSLTFFPEEQNGYDTIWSANKVFSTHPFFIHATEVSNGEYKTFLQTHTAPAYYPDTMVWKADKESDDPYVHYYFQHKAYSGFPVVGVNHWQAVQFCQWKTKELQALLQSKGITGYRVVVDLPAEWEWQAAYSFLFPKWLKSQKNTSNMIPNSNAYILGGSGYRANFAEVGSQRFQNLRLPFLNYATGGVLSPVKSYPSVYGLYNLLGNVAEWTSTSAKNNLYNSEQFMYTYSEKFIPNPNPVDSSLLRKMLYKPEVMAAHFAVKGGSWKEEYFYLQPAAVQFRDQMYRASNIGFRYVVRVYELKK